MIIENQTVPIQIVTFPSCIFRKDSANLKGHFIQSFGLANFTTWHVESQTANLVGPVWIQSSTARGYHMGSPNWAHVGVLMGTKWGHYMGPRWVLHGALHVAQTGCSWAPCGPTIWALHGKCRCVHRSAMTQPFPLPSPPLPSLHSPTPSLTGVQSA